MSESSGESHIRDAIEAALPPTVRPWHIEVARKGPTQTWCVELQHEASNGLALHSSTDDVDTAIDQITKMLGHYAGEIRRIAAAPALTNPAAVLEVRTLASIFSWTKTEVRAVARMVQQWALSNEEAEWLIETIGRDAPPPGPTQEF